MPQFRLELPDKQVRVRKTCIFFTKNNYAPEVKTTDWEKYQEGLPKDNNPYCPGSLNYHLSHYNRIRNGPEEPFITEAQAAGEQIHSKDAVKRLYHIPNKYMINYYTYTDTLACETDLSNKICPDVCAGSFSTTMQKSYRPPHPYIMQRFSFPTIPFLLHRRYKWDTNPESSPHKFYDDGYIDQIKQLQSIKSSKTVSYDPLRAQNTDGTLPPERHLKCFTLDY